MAVRFYSDIEILTFPWWGIGRTGMATRKATPEELEELQKSMMAWGIGAHRPRPAPDDSADKSAKTEEKAKPEKTDD